MHKIAVQDRYFDVHRGECEDGYIFALHKLSWLLKTAPFQHEGTNTPVELSSLVCMLLMHAEGTSGDPVYT